MPTRINTAIPDRASLFLANLINQSPDAAARSLLAPDTLTPKEHRDFVDRVFGEGESYGKSVARFISNPLTIMGFALAMRWPAPSLSSIAPTVKSLAKYDEYMPSVLRKLTGAFEMFLGTGVDDAIAYTTKHKARYFDKFMLPGLGHGLDEYATMTGRLPNAAEQIQMGWSWDMQASKEKTLDLINRLIDQRAKRTGLNDLKPLSMADLEPKSLSAAQARLVGKTRDLTVAPQYGVLREAHENGSLPELFDALAKRGTTTNAARLKRMRGTLADQTAGYFPHQLIRDPLEIQQVYEKTAMEMLDPRIAGRMNTAAAANQTHGAIVKRLNLTVPSAKQARLLADNGLLPKKTADALERLEAYHKDPINEVGRLAQRDMRMVEVVRHHTDAMGRAYVWTVKRDDVYKKGVGQYLREKVGELTASGESGKRVAAQLANNYIPAMLGRSTTEQYMKNLEHGAIREWTARMLDLPATENLFGSKIVNFLKDANNYGSPWMTWHGASGKAASWLYLSTLGFNPAPAAQNLFQSLLTTGAIIKPKYMMQGLSETWSGFRKVMKLEAGGMTEREAIAKIFPHFHGEGLTASPLYQDVVWQAAGAPAGMVETKVGKSLFEKASEKALRMFQLTERFNHLLAFNSSRAQALAEGLDLATASKTAAKVSKLTQMWAGEFSIPSNLQNVSPLLRQYLSFPEKLAAFTALSAAGGAGIGPGRVFNPGTLGRAIVGSMGAYEAGRAMFGTDLSRSILFGSLPGPEASGPFAPFPLVPPVVGLAGAAALDVARGEFRETPRSLPVLFPGGLEAARLIPAFGAKAGLPGPSKAIASFLRRPYAAWDEAGPDGTVPVYGAEGQLQMRMTPWQIVAKASGFPVGGEQEARALRKYLIRQRGVIRGYRKQFLDAMMTNDSQGMMNLDAEYQSRFGLGPIQIKKSEIKAAELRRVAPDIERAINALPPDSRALYSGVVSGAMANVGTEMFGADPMVFATGTPRSRRAA